MDITNIGGRQAQSYESNVKASKKIKPDYIGTPRRDTSQSWGRSVRYSEIIVATLYGCV